MLCPRCRIPVLDKTCPNCGQEVGPAKKRPVPLERRSAQPPIQFELTTSQPAGDSGATDDWRTELKRRLDKRAGKTNEDSEEPALSKPKDVASPSGGDSATPEESGQPKPIFSYEMRSAVKPATEATKSQVRPKVKAKKESKPKERIEPQPTPLEKPLIRFAGAPQSDPDRPLQRRLELQPPPVRPSIFFDPAERVKEPLDRPELSGRAESVSREILFSRFLCGIIDCSFPVLIALGFALLAAAELDLDVFSSESLIWVGSFSAAFFVFNSLFFLLTSGQTLGMYLTELKLVDEDTHEGPTLASVLFRVIVFLPVTLTVVGLLWALFDSSRRCLHDIFSGTIVKRRD